MNGVLSRRVCFAVSVLALLAIVLRLAWLGDDAYITLRSVENWVRGNGLRWNAGDRVQTYTHPLWMLVLAAGRWLSGEVYFTTITISLAAALAAMSLLLAGATTSAALVATAVMLAGTRAFVEYATSGLETPLVYLLLVLFAGVVVRGQGMVRCRRAVLLAALLATTRMDLALLCAPAVLATMRGLPRAAMVRAATIASLPFLLWLAFATAYYGSPFPVTAHAKAFGVGIPAGEMAMQGLRYAAFALTDDPVLLPAILLGLALGCGQAATRALALGGLLYVGYVVKVGGDFMAGRFFLPPFVVAVAILAAWLSARPRATAAWVVAATAIGLVALRGVPAWMRAPASDLPPSEAQLEAQHGIGDERRVYYAQLGLFAPTRVVPAFGALQAVARPAGGGRWILLNGAVGAAGFGAGADGHVLDPLLCDPLLTRLPAHDPTRWRIGHVLRRVPEGYYETLATGENRLLHPGLREYYSALQQATRAPVFAAERWAALWRLAAGSVGDGLRAFVAEHYRTPPRVDVAAATLPPELPPGTYWFDDARIRIVYEGGLAVALPEPRAATSLRLQAASTLFCRYRCRFLRRGEVRGEAMAAPLPPAAGQSPLQQAVGMQDQIVLVPSGLGTFDTLWIDFVGTALAHAATGPAAIGAVSFTP